MSQTGLGAGVGAGHLDHLVLAVTLLLTWAASALLA